MPQLQGTTAPLGFRTHEGRRSDQVVYRAEAECQLLFCIREGLRLKPEFVHDCQRIVIDN
jgi:hypothetical protein